MWRTTDISGKIFTNNQVIIPDGAEGKIVVEALWIAKSTKTQGQAIGTLSDDKYGAGKVEKSSFFVENIAPIATSSLLLVGGIMLIIVLLKKEKKIRMSIKKKAVAFDNEVQAKRYWLTLAKVVQ